MSKVVGLLVGRENTFPGPFIETVTERPAHAYRELAVPRNARARGARYSRVVVASATVPYYART